ncbi:hypothetical protein J22TS1_43530 [Siminovitchia terrae]|uniref:DUF2971 domain-containing protein n=1 Tax=Siminovitchia terrae TaxID=1914933 RepID=UPI001B2C2697|nr:DUF2971 domain-containing protein [Siminovitchia terrae]GIN93302.1 hypothetical protein J22TS1_43530 [Siminovitchia terrae]
MKDQGRVKENVDFVELYNKIKQKSELNPYDKIIRYMNFAKLIGILETEELFLTRADKFEDLYEGIFPESYISISNADNFNKKPLDKNEVNNQSLKEEIELAKQKTFISCWNLIRNESYAMWKIYGESNGVAIQSTIKSLQNLLEGTNAVIRKVIYIDEDNHLVYAPPDNDPYSMINFFSIKKKYYKYEEEIRVILIDETDKKNTIKINKIEDLISKIYVSPFAEDWFLQLVKKVVRQRYKLDIDVDSSEIRLNN